MSRVGRGLISSDDSTGAVVLPSSPDILPTIQGGFGRDMSAATGQPEFRDGTAYVPQNHVNVWNYLNTAQQADVLAGTLGEDCTVAIQSAYTDAYALTVGHLPTGGAYTYATVPVVFPGGIYGISDHILPANGYSRTVGLGNALLVQSDPTKDIFDFAGGYMVRLDNMTLVGGKRQVRFGNANTDASSLTLNNCELLHNVGGPAIQFYTQSGAANLSCLFTMRGGRILSVYQAFEGVSGVDSFFEDVWVYVQNSGAGNPPDMGDVAVFVNKNVMVFRRMYGVPPPDGPTTSGRWVDNYGIFIAEAGTRFGGEGGGLPIVYQYDSLPTAYPWIATNSAVILRDSFLACGPTTDAKRGLIRFVTGVPQTIAIKNNPYMVLDSADLFTVEAGFDVAAYLAALNANVKITIDISGNTGWLPTYMENLPTALFTDPNRVVYRGDHRPLIVDLTYGGLGAAVTPSWYTDGQQMVLTITDGSAFGIVTPEYPPTTSGNTMTFTLKNTSGGAIGNVTWDTGFKTSWSNVSDKPATGYQRTLTFRWDGTNWVEVSKTPNDVPN